MRKFVYVLLFCFLLAACQDSNIKNRLKGNVKEDSGDIDVTETSVEELRISESDLQGITVKEGTVTANGREVQEDEDVNITVTMENEDDYDENEDEKELPEGTLVMKRQSGYRIQLLTVTKKESAQSFGAEFKEKWSEASQDKENEDAYYYKDDIPLYIEYYEPYWKLRAGNYPGRADASKQLELIKKLGYEDAWIVKTVILVEE